MECFTWCYRNVKNECQELPVIGQSARNIDPKDLIQYTHNRSGKNTARGVGGCPHLTYRIPVHKQRFVRSSDGRMANPSSLPLRRDVPKESLDPPPARYGRGRTGCLTRGGCMMTSSRMESRRHEQAGKGGRESGKYMGMTNTGKAEAAVYKRG